MFITSSPQGCNFIKKEALTQVFSCEFCEISKNTFLTEHLRTTASIDYKWIINKSGMNKMAVTTYCKTKVFRHLHIGKLLSQNGNKY